VIAGITKWPLVPWATLPRALDVSSGNQFAALLAVPDVQIVLLMIAKPFDRTPRSVAGLPSPMGVSPWPSPPRFTGYGGERQVYLSDVGYTTGAADVPAHTHFPGRLAPALDWRLRLFETVEPDGRARVSVADVAILDPTGEHDALLDLAWDGREVKLLAGTQDLSLSEFGTVMRGDAATLAWDENGWRIRVREQGVVFTNLLARARYGGGGGTDGDAEITGTRAPYCAGRVRNVSPIRVVAADELYQVHDGETQAIDAVRDAGVELTFAADFTTGAALLAATTGAAMSGADIEAGEYGTCLAEGLFRLAAMPAGDVTADVRGDASGGYVDDTANIVRRIVTTRLSGQALSDPSDLDAGAFAVFSSAQPAEVGIYLRDERTVESVITEMLFGSGGYWWFDRLGRLTVGRLEAPTAPVRTIDSSTILAIERLDMAPPSYQRRVAWRRIWTLQSDDGLADSVPDDQRALYTTEQRFAVSTDSEVRGRHQLARDVETPGLFDVEADALTEAARLQALHGVQRDRYRVQVERLLFQVFPGESVTLKHPRFGLANGRNFVVVGLEENTLTGTTVLELWG